MPKIFVFNCKLDKGTNSIRRYNPARCLITRRSNNKARVMMLNVRGKEAINKAEKPRGTRTKSRYLMLASNEIAMFGLSVNNVSTLFRRYKYRSPVQDYVKTILLTYECLGLELNVIVFISNWNSPDNTYGCRCRYHYIP